MEDHGSRDIVDNSSYSFRRAYTLNISLDNALTMKNMPNMSVHNVTHSNKPGARFYITNYYDIKYFITAVTSLYLTHSYCSRVDGIITVIIIMRRSCLVVQRSCCQVR